LPKNVIPSHKHWFAAVLSLLILFSFAGEASASDKGPKVGRFSTNYGPLILYEGKDNRLAGFYYYEGLPAHLFLKRNDKGSYKGIWVQADSEQKCATKKNGSPFWGTINAAFKNGKFLALWNYCDAPLVNKKSRQWKGTPK